MKTKTKSGISVNVPTSIPVDWNPSKSEIELLASKFLHPYIEGEITAEHMAIVVDTFKKTIERIEKEVRPMIAKELHSRYSKADDIVVKGCKLELMEAGVRYDYCNCNDSYYEDLKHKESEIQLQIKERELMLKSIGYGKTLQIVHPETGEIMEVRSPIRYSTESYKIKIPD
jgi:hypothetical protein